MTEYKWSTEYKYGRKDVLQWQSDNSGLNK